MEKAIIDTSALTDEQLKLLKDAFYEEARIFTAERGLVYDRPSVHLFETLFGRDFVNQKLIKI